MSLIRKQVAGVHTETVFEGPALVALQEQQAPSGDGIFHISAAQERIWFLEQLEPGNPTNLLFHAFRLIGNLNHEALQVAIDQMVRRHETLRTTFAAAAIYAGIDGRPVPIVAESTLPAFPLLDLSRLPETERESQASDLTKLEARDPFDLTKGPLYRTKLLRMSKSEHILLLSMHRMIADDESCMIFIKELFSFYESFINSSPVEIKPLTMQYSTFASRQREWLQTDTAKDRIENWKQLLHGAPALLELPTDRPRPPKRGYAGARASIDIPSHIVNALDELGRRADSNLSVVLVTAFQSLLARYTSQPEIVVGISVPSRSAETKSLIGPLANTVVVRTKIVGEQSFLEQLKRTANSMGVAISLQQVPFEHLLEELHPQRSLSHTPVFQVMLQLKDSDPLSYDLRELTVREVDHDTEVSEFDLTVSGHLPGRSRGETLRLCVDYNTELFDASTIERLLKNFVNLLAAFATNPEQRLSAAQLIGNKESEELNEWNNTKHSYRRDLCVHELIEKQVAVSPSKVAVVFGEQQVSYKELNRRANQLAAYLKQHVGDNGLVGICLERGPEMIVALLAVLKAGAAYVPLDAEYPSSRLAFMIGDAGLQLIITQADLRERLPAVAAKVISLAAEAEQIAAEATGDLGRTATPTSLAYVIYTSGSTGEPKAVEITHGAVVNFLTAMEARPGLSAAERLLAVTTLSFDIAGLELYLPLTVGGCVEMTSRAEAGDGKYLIEKLRSGGITTMQATPATWRLLLEAGWQGNGELRILCGGEALPRDLANELLRRGQAVWNMYGPTETTIWSAVGEVEMGDGPVLLGQPINNTQLHVLDQDLNLVPIGVPGELFIGGEGLARGYLHRAALTAERFLPNPFASEAGARMYRTGDLVRRKADGRLEFLGRLDQQVKIRGFRIELGEVRNTLSLHASVKENVIAATPDTSSGGQRLIAYLVPEQESVLDVGEIRTFLKSKLPDYMIPAAFITLPNLPVTSNGKVDLKALPPINGSRSTVHINYEKPQDPVEAQLVTIWQKVLGVAPIGVGDNFFELGGHSLLAVRLFAQIENRFGRALALATLFQAPTIRELAGILRKGERRQWSSLVAIRSTGAKPPLFCIHAAGANVLIYRPLAHHLDMDRPVYALQALGLDGITRPLTRVENMAAHYIKEIRAVQPNGPYYLLGGSFGGLVAFEMAQQLRERGEEVAMLALLDTYCPLHSLAQRVRCHWVHLTERGPAQYSADAFMALRERLRRTSLPSAPNPKVQAEFAKVLPKQTEFQDPLFRTVEANIEAENTYVPRNKVFRGRIIYFYAEDLGGAPPHEDNRLRWTRMATDGIEVHRIPGTHVTMREEPNVALLTKILTDCLEKAHRLSKPNTGA